MATGISSSIITLATLLQVTAFALIHHHMSPAELRSVFQVESHDQVPQYEVVRVWKRSLPEESVHHVQMRAFGRALSLRLRPTQGLLRGDVLRAWEAVANASDVLYTELPSDPEELGKLYQDHETQAAMLVHRDKEDGRLLMEGTIGHDLVVRPVPASVRQHLDEKPEDPFDDEMFLDDEGEDIKDDVAVEGFPLKRVKRSVRTHQHIVFKRSVGSDDYYSDYAFMEPDQLPKKLRSKRSIIKREAPYVIYPEILVIVDYDGYRLHGGDNVQIKRYFVSFWNGVDLRYKLLKGPKIRISIAGIIISRGRDATPYLERNRVGRDAIDSASALTDMGKYLFRERRLPVYDIAVAVTKYDMCRRRKGGRCTKGTAGFAYVGGACVVNKRLEKVNSVAIIEDTGGFSGIIVGAHEVGHLLGAVHDGSPPPGYLAGPGAEKCRWEDGYIMSDLRHTDRGFRWSPCSVASFHHFLNGDTATCLYNSPHEDESLPRVLPGKLLSLDAQCRKDRGTSACFKDDRVCAQLFCFDSNSGYCVAYRPAAEGSPCGDGQYCLNGRCVAEHENIIPDYSQNTPSYIRRNDADLSATQSRPVYINPPNITRSPWGDQWSRSSSATQSTFTSTTLNPYNFNHYFTSTKNPYTTSTNFNQFQYQSTAKNVLDYYRNLYTSTTQNPHINNLKTHNFVDNKIPSTTKNPYDFRRFQKSTVSQNIQNLNVFLASSSVRSPDTTQRPHFGSNTQYNHTSTTIKQYQPFSYSTSTNSHPILPNITTERVVDGTDCVDLASNFSGSVSCHDFLVQYGSQYCSNQYIKSICCASHRTMCSSKI